MITKFKIFEGKFLQEMYHFTSFENLIEILKSNSLKEGNSNYISLTRNKNYYKNADDVPANIRLTLDAEKINNNYKIFPFQHQYFQDVKGNIIKSFWKGHPDRDLSFKEYEEIIKTKELKNLNKYLIKISYSNYLKDKFLNNNIIQQYIKKYKINFDFY